MTETFQVLQDIEELPAPAGNNLAEQAVMALGLCLLLVLAFKIYRRQTSRRKRASRMLARMRRAARNKEIPVNELHSLGFTIAHTLSTAIGINGITPTTVLPRMLRQYDRRWSVFRDRLATVRYAKNEQPRADDIVWLIDEARYWLSRWP